MLLSLSEEKEICCVRLMLSLKRRGLSDDAYIRIFNLGIQWNVLQSERAFLIGSARSYIENKSLTSRIFKMSTNTHKNPNRKQFNK